MQYSTVNLTKQSETRCRLDILNTISSGFSWLMSEFMAFNSGSHPIFITHSKEGSGDLSKNSRVGGKGAEFAEYFRKNMCI